jgi:hypothetical protein
LGPVFYFLAEHYPWWGIPCILIFGEAANHFRRNGMRMKLFFCASLSLMFLLLTVLYFFVGYEHVRPTLQGIEAKQKL